MMMDRFFEVNPVMQHMISTVFCAGFRRLIVLMDRFFEVNPEMLHMISAEFCIVLSNDSWIQFHVTLKFTGTDLAPQPYRYVNNLVLCELFQL